MDKPHETLDDRSIVMAEMMTPEVVNFSGHVHGGHLMRLLDKVAYACAARYAGQYVVTLSADQIIFKQPIFVGELVIFYASVNYVGTSSMEIGIRVMAENLMTHEQRHTNTCYFTMVALNEKGKPTKIKPLELRNPLEEYRFQEALIRKEMRLEYAKLHEAHKQKRSLNKA
jgi:acyl-CoA hydrolase